MKICDKFYWILGTKPCCVKRGFNQYYANIILIILLAVCDLIKMALIDTKRHFYGKLQRHFRTP